jgi:eukaryotic-like serine/threonine-protein kinase
MTAAGGEAGRGDWLGRYRVVVRLGRGGMATVYLAASLGPDDFSKLVVIKELMPELSDDPNFVRMFRAEARLAARLQHPNVVQTYDAWQLEGRQFLTMEFLDGQPLQRALVRLGRGSLGLPAQLYVLRSVLAALHYAHELCDYDGTPLGVVHRDVSPQNVFLTYDGQVKLVDFGIAKAAGMVTTEAGTFKGKANYASPEQIMGEEVDRRADVFAAGVMLWEALTGRPICEPGREPANLLFERLQGRDPSVLAVNPQADPALAAICARAMAHAPAARFASAQEFREALEAHPLGAPAPAIAAGLGAQLASAFAAERGEVQRAIEAVLSSTASPPLGAALTPGASPDAEPSTNEAWLSSRPTLVKTLGHRPSGFARRAVLAVGVMFAIGAGAWQVRRSLWPVSARAAGGGARKAVFETGSAASRPELVEVSIRAQPEHATIFLDGEPLRGNPVLLSMPRDARQHRVRAEGEGLVSEERLVSFEVDTHVIFKLSWPPAGEPSARGGRPASRPGARAKPGAPAAAPPAAKRRAPGRDIDDDPYGP